MEQRVIKISLPPGWSLLTPIAEDVNTLMLQLAALGSSGWLYRGESKYYADARATLGRALSDVAPDPVLAECLLLQNFKSAAHPYLSSAERAMATDVFSWFVLMQHHGAPTRLLDWSLSPWVAAFHASGGDASEGYIWAVNGDGASLKDDREASKSLLCCADASTFYEAAVVCKQFLVGFGAVEMTSRMLAQQGTFTTTNPATADHKALLIERAQPGNAIVLVIPPNLKPALRQALWRMNITAATLFPGIDGVGAFIADIPKYKIPVPPAMPMR